MRSTPIILDRLRHIKYDLQAVWDMEYLVDGGFASILEKEVTFELCQSLLWFGLISEDPHLTMENTKKLMEDAGVGKEGQSLIDVFTVCAKELFDSGFLYIPEQKPEEDLAESNEIPAQSVREHILELVAMAEAAGLVDSDQIWKHTPKEIENLFEVIESRNKLKNTLMDFRMGMICKVVFESQGIKKNGGMMWSWEDFAPNREPKQQTPEEMLALIQAASAAMGGYING